MIAEIVPIPEEGVGGGRGIKRGFSNKKCNNAPVLVNQSTLKVGLKIPR